MKYKTTLIQFKKMVKNFIKCLVIIVVMPLLSGCSKDNMEVDESFPGNLSLTDAQDYFEQYLSISPIIDSKTKSHRECGPFFTGDFTVNWKQAVYSKNDVLNGYDIPLYLPKYKYTAVRNIYEDGKIITYEVEVYQRLVIMQDNETGSLCLYIQTLIPDKDYYEQNKRKDKYNYASFSNKNRYSGIIIHSIPQRGTIVKISRYLNGEELINEFLVSDNKQELENKIKSAYRFIGPVQIKSKVRLITKSGECEGEGVYGEGEGSNINGYTDLGGGLYFDGVNYWEYIDGEWIQVLSPAIIIEDKDPSGGSSGEFIDPGEGSSGSNNGSGGVDSGYNENGNYNISDSEAYQYGLDLLDQIYEKVKEDDVCYYEIDLQSQKCEQVEQFVGIVYNVESLCTSMINAVKNAPSFLIDLVKASNIMSVYLGAPNVYRTFVAIVNGDTDAYTSKDLVNAASTILSAIGLHTFMIPGINVLVNVSACVLGIIGSLMEGHLNSPAILNLPLSDGSNMLLLIV